MIPTISPVTAARLRCERCSAIALKSLLIAAGVIVTFKQDCAPHPDSVCTSSLVVTHIQILRNETGKLPPAPRAGAVSPNSLFAHTIAYISSNSNEILQISNMMVFSWYHTNKVGKKAATSVTATARC
jgi:hypothetical protein